MKSVSAPTSVPAAPDATRDARTAAEALRSSELRYLLLAESLPELISIRDSDGHIEYCNSRWLEYRGVTPAQSIIHDWKSGIPPEDLPALRAPPWRDGVPHPWEAECRIRRASDGAFRWHSVRVVPLPSGFGSPRRWLAIATDIHQRKQAEQERERLLEQLDRERRELSMQYAVIRALAGSPGLRNAAPPLVSAFCEQLGWQAGALWSVEPDAAGRPMLSLVHTRQDPDLLPADALSQSQPPPLRKGQSLAGRVWAAKEPVDLPRLSPTRGAAHHRAAAGLGLKCGVAFPIFLEGEVRGVVELFGRPRTRRDRELPDIIGSIALQIGLFIQRTQALNQLRISEEALIQSNNALEERVRERTAELREANRELSAEITERTRLEREILRISEREQRRIGQDLHDGVCQELAAIAFMMRAHATRMDARGEDTAKLHQLSQLLNDSISRCRDMARGLHPVEMDADGLMVALKDLASRTDQTVACAFSCREPILMRESDVALNLYRIAQEAVNNALKYAGAGLITILLERDVRGIRLSISDDGRGMPAPSAHRGRNPRSGMGLHTMRYRARTMGATLRIRRCRPKGTEILCSLPCK
jgi:PAS domain S-box-containing protein